MTPNIKRLFVIFNKVTLSITKLFHIAECNALFTVMGNAIIWSVILLKVVMLYVIMLNVVKVNVIILNVNMLNVHLLNVKC
jgi:hypothetical protein